jgi:hypothetical protein
MATEPEVIVDETPVVEARTVKNFRHNPDIENFYRFIHENGLRREAKMIFDSVLKNVQSSGRRKGSRKK